MALPVPTPPPIVSLYLSSGPATVKVLSERGARSLKKKKKKKFEFGRFSYKSCTWLFGYRNDIGGDGDTYDHSLKLH